MSGPIVRSGPSKKFTDNWESVFGGKPTKAKKATAKAVKKKPAKRKKPSS